jgi:hypothetical protein
MKTRNPTHLFLFVFQRRGFGMAARTRMSVGILRLCIKTPACRAAEKQKG